MITRDFAAGTPILARNTQTNRSCGIDYNLARGYICFSDASAISFYLDKGSGHGWMEAVAEPAVFGANFEPKTLGAQRNRAYEQASHFAKRFPRDFF